MPVSAGAARVVWKDAAFRQFTRSPIGPVGRDLQARAIRVTTRMRQNASARPGPEIETGNLVAAISLLRFGEDSQGLLADVGPQPHRMFRRGWNYALLLEFGHGSTPAYPFMARSLEAMAP